MRIDQNTPQEELEKLYNALVRREYLRSTPLNLKMFLGYTLLFLLFPGMVFGFWAGLGLTAAFCAVLLTLLLADHASWGVAATCIWLGIGLIPVISHVIIGTMSRARKTRKLRQMMREPLRHPSPKACIPDRLPLKWSQKRLRHGIQMVSSIVVSVPADGIYAFLLTIEHYSGARLITDGPAGVCVAESAGKPGETLNALLLYRLRQGQHELCWKVVHAEKAPAASISQLNR